VIGLAIIAESLAKLADCGINAVLNIDEDFTFPQALGDLHPRDDLSMSRHPEGPGPRRDEDPERRRCGTESFELYHPTSST
jgi:hypothetical protein